ncbi:hypothetical protein MKY95_19350 [Paenibacillus sp. FSL P4-0176]|uniref:hypothetical protein n=1 Tax=Paenibacillus sp. FSL P4-0176 TaxID=2921631 RepID=UPI0030CDFB50
MFKIAPNWYVKLMKVCAIVGLLGILPATFLEAAIWGVADGQIIYWLLIVFLVSILMPLLFSDTRNALLGATKS